MSLDHKTKIIKELEDMIQTVSRPTKPTKLTTVPVAEVPSDAPWLQICQLLHFFYWPSLYPRRNYRFCQGMILKLLTDLILCDFETRWA